jgi:hypothetical protein
MTPHLQRSRILKALTDSEGGAESFEAAEKRLRNVRVAIVLSPELAITTAGQASVLTAAAASFKCFGNVTLVAKADAPLIKSLSIGETLSAAAVALGAVLAKSVQPDTTHIIEVGARASADTASFVKCWWDGWCAGIIPHWDNRAIGSSDNALAGIFAGALAVREVFATVLGYPRCGLRVSIASLWEPWLSPETAAAGPRRVFMPTRLWLIGLGHLGQGNLWALGLLPVSGLSAILQDDQYAGAENVSTGLLTTVDDVSKRKTRIAAKWLDGAGWFTALIERRHYGDIPLLLDDPPIVITGLDEPDPRIAITRTGFEYMIDTGLGHGAIDFEGIQMRVLSKGIDASRLWTSPTPIKDVDALVKREVYRAHAAEFGECGTVSLASASVAVPFVGAAAGALAITQAIRLASMQSTCQIFQLELGSPALAMAGPMKAAPANTFGSKELQV